MVHLYVKDAECSLPRPEKELKAFKKVWLQPGETKTVELTFSKRSVAFFCEKEDDWVVEPGMVEVLIGSSSRDIRRMATLIVE